MFVTQEIKLQFKNKYKKIALLMKCVIILQDFLKLSN